MKYFRCNYSELSKLELYQILKLRAECFIIEQQMNYLDPDELDFDAHHYFFKRRGKITAYLRTHQDTSNNLKFSRICVSSNFRKQQLATQLIKSALDDALNSESSCVILIAQKYLEHFYQRFGFNKTSEVFLISNIEHIEMSCSIKKGANS